jgi:hypothetical protein
MEGHMVCFHLYEVSSMGKPTDTKQIGACQKLGIEHCVMDTVLFWGDEMFWNYTWVFA